MTARHQPAAKRPMVIVLHGPTGVGKDSVIDRLRERTGIYRPTSTTDRPPRDGECDGDHYHFVSTGEFLRRVEAGRFIEHADVYGQKKGLQVEEILGPLGEGRDIVIRTDVSGARTWRRKLEGAVFVILLPEHIDAGIEEHLETIRHRVNHRAGADDPRLNEHLSQIEEELLDAPNNDYAVTNRAGELEATVDELIRILEFERANPARATPRLRLDSEAS